MEATEKELKIRVGDLAPDFELPAVVGEQKTRFRLSDYRGKKNVVMAFYPLNFTPV
jgi:peroxiredoxin